LRLLTRPLLLRRCPQGLLLFLCSEEPAAQQLRQRATWALVPMLNPDGVAEGNYRCDAAGR
jgi:murein tripeptide amidase MpaA